MWNNKQTETIHTNDFPYIQEIHKPVGDDQSVSSSHQNELTTDGLTEATEFYT